jgi:hypothetical protein
VHQRARHPVGERKRPPRACVDLQPSTPTLHAGSRSPVLDQLLAKRDSGTPPRTLIETGDRGLSGPAPSGLVTAVDDLRFRPRASLAASRVQAAPSTSIPVRRKGLRCPASLHSRMCPKVDGPSLILIRQQLTSGVSFPGGDRRCGWRLRPSASASDARPREAYGGRDCRPSRRRARDPRSSRSSSGHAVPILPERSTSWPSRRSGGSELWPEAATDRLRPCLPHRASQRGDWPKLRAGDSQIPEGIYRVTALNPKQQGTISPSS